MTDEERELAQLYRRRFGSDAEAKEQALTDLDVAMSGSCSPCAGTGKLLRTVGSTMENVPCMTCGGTGRPRNDNPTAKFHAAAAGHFLRFLREQNTDDQGA